MKELLDSNATLSRNGVDYSSTIINRDSSLSFSEEVMLPADAFYTQPQVRLRFDPTKLDALKRSLVKNGQLQPIIVLPRDDSGKHLIVCGEYRYRAAREIEGFKLKANVIEDASQLSSADLLRLQVVENYDRDNLNLVELAMALDRFRSEFGYSQEKIADEMGWRTKEGKLNNKKVSRILNILKLDAKTLTLVSDGIIRDIVCIEHLAQLKQRCVLHCNMKYYFACLQTIQESSGVTRKETQRWLATLPGIRRTVTPPDPNTKRFEQQLSEFIGREVLIEPGKRGKGYIKIAYYDNDDLNNALSVLGINITDWF